MAAGNDLLTDEDKAKVEAAVQAAEAHTGMQFLVYLGKSKRDTRKHAQQALESQGYHQLQGVLIFVSPRRKALEVVTSPAAKGRISDDQAKRAVDIMLPAFSKGDWVAGVQLGLSALAEDAGPLPEGATAQEELPDIL